MRFLPGISRFAVKKPAGMKPPPMWRLLRTGAMKAGFRQSGDSLEFFGSFCFKTKRTHGAND
jgi:hypothetical protein